MCEKKQNLKAHSPPHDLPGYKPDSAAPRKKRATINSLPFLAAAMAIMMTPQTPMIIGIHIRAPSRFNAKLDGISNTIYTCHKYQEDCSMHRYVYIT